MRFATLYTFGFHGFPLALGVPLPVDLAAITALVEGAIGDRTTLLLATLTVNLPTWVMFSVREVRMMTSSEWVELPGIGRVSCTASRGGTGSQKSARLWRNVPRNGLPTCESCPAGLPAGPYIGTEIAAT